MFKPYHIYFFSLLSPKEANLLSPHVHVGESVRMISIVDSKSYKLKLLGKLSIRLCLFFL